MGAKVDVTVYSTLTLSLDSEVHLCYVLWCSAYCTRSPGQGVPKNFPLVPLPPCFLPRVRVGRMEKDPEVSPSFPSTHIQLPVRIRGNLITCPLDPGSTRLAHCSDAELINIKKR